MAFIDCTQILMEDVDIPEEQFQKRNMIMHFSSVIFMIAGPLFIYFGFYLLTWPYTVKWGALSIALGFLILLFGFSLWQDRQIMTLCRMYKKENAEIKQLLRESMKQ
jgi:small neutral amino acid transporter SnatA (MarC family)